MKAEVINNNGWVLIIPKEADTLFCEWLDLNKASINIFNEIKNLGTHTAIRLNATKEYYTSACNFINDNYKESNRPTTI